MDERAKRLGLNEVAFRSANERVREVAEGFSLVAEQCQFICECGGADCAQPVTMTLPEYEHVRSRSEWFFVVPGHEILDIERIVEEHDGYFVIEKLPGGPAELARQEDDSR